MELVEECRPKDRTSVGASELKAMLERAVLEERKACAKICFDYKARLAHISYSDWPSGHTAAEDCMEEINERSNR